MIETMNHYHQIYDAEDPSEDVHEDDLQEFHSGIHQPHPHPHPAADDAAFDDINEVFIRELFKREASFNLAPSSAPAPIPEVDGNVHRPKRKRPATSSSLPSKSIRSDEEAEFKLKPDDSEDPDTTPFLTFKDMKNDIRSKTREQLEHEVNRFNQELEVRKAELGLGESSHLDLSTMKKRREKWSPDEMGTLWGAISLHGNNWTAISKIVPGRNYFQVKDKGRRELCGRGWETGRKKSEGSEAMLHAQAIAQMELQSYFKMKAAARDAEASQLASSSHQHEPFKQ